MHVWCDSVGEMIERFRRGDFVLGTEDGSARLLECLRQASAVSGQHARLLRGLSAKPTGAGHGRRYVEQAAAELRRWERVEGDVEDLLLALLRQRTGGDGKDRGGRARA